MYKILSSGSKGNAVIYFDTILVDCGVPFSIVKPYLKDIQIILLTHSHGDHLNVNTIKKTQSERPAVRFGCGEFLTEKLTEIKNVDIFQAGRIYDYGAFKVSPIVLYHDVPNFGYRIFKGGKKILHATDSRTLDGISAKEYDLYCLECNYDEERVYSIIGSKRERGEYAYQLGSINSHLSVQQSQDFVLRNAGKEYQFVQLHQSSEF